MYIGIPVNLCPSKYPLDLLFYPVSSHFPTRHPFSRQFSDRFEDSSPPDTHTFEDNLATLLIWFSPSFMIEKLGKLEIFELSTTGVLWLDYLYLVIKIIFLKFTIVMKTGNESINSYFFKIIWS